MLLIDLKKGAIVSDEEIKAELANAQPYKQWLAARRSCSKSCPRSPRRRRRTDVPLLDRQQAFGYTQEDLKLILPPMATTGQEAVGSMGTDTPISAMSDESKLLYTYFKQNFAQVTNPPIDSIREELVMSLGEPSSARGRTSSTSRACGRGSASKCASPSSPMPISKRSAPSARMEDNPFRSKTLDITYPVAEGAEGMERALDQLFSTPRWPSMRATTSSSCPTAWSGPDRVAIPALLATAGVHHHLIRKGLRTSVGLVVETGEAREVASFLRPRRLWCRSDQPLTWRSRRW